MAATTAYSVDQLNELAERVSQTLDGSPILAASTVLLMLLQRCIIRAATNKAEALLMSRKLGVKLCETMLSDYDQLHDAMQKAKEGGVQ
jgi:hypothetical protein